MILYSQYYGEDKPYSEVLQPPLTEAWLKKTASALMNTKNAWLKREDGKIAYIIKNGQYEIEIHNYPGVFLKWAEGEVAEFPPQPVVEAEGAEHA